MAFPSIPKGSNILDRKKTPSECPCELCRSRIRRLLPSSNGFWRSGGSGSGSSSWNFGVLLLFEDQFCKKNRRSFQKRHFHRSWSSSGCFVWIATPHRDNDSQTSQRNLQGLLQQITWDTPYITLLKHANYPPASWKINCWRFSWLFSNQSLVQKPYHCEMIFSIFPLIFPSFPNRSKNIG